MNRIAALFLMGTALCAAAPAVQAADLMMDAPSASYGAAAHDWSGGYVGAFGGLGAGTVDWTGDYYIGDDIVGSDEGSFDASGWLLGVDAGANIQMDSLVFGVEGDLAWTDISGEGGPIDGNDIDSSVPSMQLDWMGSIRGRVGVAMDNFMVYGTAGWAMAGGSMMITNLDTLDDDRTADVSASGWTAGIGAEMALDDNISIKAEYLYTALSMESVDFGGVAPADQLTANADFGVSTVKVGLNFGF